MEQTISGSNIRQLKLWETAVLQLAPGAGTFAAFAVIAYLLHLYGLPNMIALGLAILFVEVPISWSIIVYISKKESGGSFSLRKAFPWTAGLRWWKYLLIGVPFIVFSMVIIAGVGPAISNILRESFFAWVPGWFVMHPDPKMFSAYPREVIILLWLLIMIGMVLFGGITQELYSRGFLLPRTAHMGFYAPAYNALLFTVSHLIAPWEWTGFFIMILPWSYLVWWQRSVKIGIFVHVGMLALQWVMMSLILFGIVPIPAN